MAAIKTAYQTYQRQGVLTASPLELVIMLYKGCIRQLNLGKVSIEKKDYQTANAAFQKAQDILSELMLSLDFSYEISSELMRLYEYIQWKIVDINANKASEEVDGVVEILDELQSSWVAIKTKTAVSSVK